MEIKNKAVAQNNIEKNNKIDTREVYKTHVSRLKVKYYEEIMESFVKHFKCENKYQCPKIKKVVLSMGLGKRDIKKNVNDLTLIAGQKAVVTKAKKSVSQFAVRIGHDSGAKVTLRNNNMYHFLDRLINMALLNWRAFPGLFKRSISITKGNANISLGIRDDRIFNEVKNESLKSEGLDITICTNCKNHEELQFLLSSFGLPFRG
jgi:large subunit ribosomal protein L5